MNAVLVPWKMPERGKETLIKAKVSARYLHGPEGELPQPKELIEAAKQADVLLSRATLDIPDEVMKGSPNLKGIANWGVGFNNINVALATQLGIPVTNTPGVLTETTADLAWTLIMATARRIPQAHQHVLSGEWKGPGGKVFMGMDVGPGGSNMRKTLGIIGFGKIGQAMYRRSKGFKMKVLVYDPPMKEIIQKTQGVEYRDLDDLLRESDFVTLHSPLTKETGHLIGEKEFNLMKSTAIFVNTSRGPIVDEKALVKALQQKVITGAGLDVYENEPKLTPGLTELNNVVLLPHIGSASEDTRGQMAFIAAKNAIMMLKGKRPVDIVNPKVFDSAEYRKRIEK